MKKSLFGTSGIRGHSVKLFTPQFCFDIGRTFVEFLKRHDLVGPVAVGMDPRGSSPRIKQELLKGLFSAGVELFDEGATPIPSINWLLKSTPIVGGVMITGSHIAPELNGMKFFAHDEEVSDADQKEIENIYLEIKGSELSDKLEVHLENRARELYLELLQNNISTSFPKWRVALDCANGAQSVVIPDFKSLGLEVFEINCDIQSDFIARDTDTDDKAQVEDLKALVKKEKCDFGIAFDGDGDRSVFIDENGEFVLGEYSCSLIAKTIESNKIVTTISASQVVDTLGKQVYRTKVGSPHVIGKMKEETAVFGFEQNGGAIFADIMYTRDGGMVAVRLLNLFAKHKGSFSEMVGELPKYHMFRTKVDYKWELKEEILTKAKEKFEGKKTEEVDGLKMWIDDDTWILFRSSANAPEFRVFAESKDESKAKELLDEGVDFVKKIIAND